MKRFVLPGILLLLVATPLYAVRITSVEDVIRMHESGVSEEVLLASVQQIDEPLLVTDDDVRSMKNAGVPKKVIEAVVASAEPRAQHAAEGKGESVEEDGDYCLTFDPPVVVLWPEPYFVPAWLWDPHWFMPRLDSRVGSKAKQPPERAKPPVVTREPRGSRQDARARPAEPRMAPAIARRSE